MKKYEKKCYSTREAKYYIGLSEADSVEGAWIWVTGEYPEYAAWKSYKPTKSTEKDCAVYKEGKRKSNLYLALRH